MYDGRPRPSKSAVFRRTRTSIVQPFWIGTCRRVLGMCSFSRMGRGTMLQWWDKKGDCDEPRALGFADSGCVRADRFVGDAGAGLDATVGG